MHRLCVRTCWTDGTYCIICTCETHATPPTNDTAPTDAAENAADRTLVIPSVMHTSQPSPISRWQTARQADADNAHRDNTEFAGHHGRKEAIAARHGTMRLRKNTISS
mmetsp:Transcript_46837/g.116745  ORF Transcript_46837/g.116745 Transcript_46837/m.116745 type:complete len:108 (+) Transcript_46837:150-473(+)